MRINQPHCLCVDSHAYILFPFGHIKLLKTKKKVKPPEAPILWPPDGRANSLEKALMLGKTDGKRRRGQQRSRWLDGITDSMDMSLSQLREMAKWSEQYLLMAKTWSCFWKQHHLQNTSSESALGENSPPLAFHQRHSNWNLQHYFSSCWGWLHSLIMRISSNFSNTNHA